MSKLILRLTVTLGLLGFLAYQMDWPRLGHELGHMRIQFWLLAIVVYLLAQVASTLRWRWLAQPLGFDQPSSHFLRYYFIGMFANMFLPTAVGGDVVRAFYLDARSGRRLAAFLSVLADRGSGLLVLLALACVGVLAYQYPLDPKVLAAVWMAAGLAAFSVSLVALIAFWKPKSVRNWDEQYTPDKRKRGWRAKAKHARARLRALTLSLAHAFTLYVHRPALLIGTTLLSIVVQAASVLLVWLIGQALEVPVPASYYWIFVPMVSLLTMLPSIAGGGVREYSTFLLLAPLGVSQEKAFALAFMWFAAMFLASMTGIPFYLFGRYPRFFRSAEGTLGQEAQAPSVSARAPNREVRFNDGSFRRDPDQRRAGEPSPA
ncbi:MAG: lysylphosphatidylglycerol synthase transmembrane domain-containing protein [Gemmataceae bacterium]